MLEWFERLTLVQFVAVLTAANIAMYSASWAGVSVLQRMFARRIVNAERVVVRRRDVLLSFVIVLINIGIGIPGWWLWSNGHILLVERPLAATVADAFLAFVFFDVCMYGLHRIMHVSRLYRLSHERHHQHADVSGLSLYVMNPIEAAGFGLLLIGFLSIRPYSIHALIVYLFFNWLYGTMGHSALPVRGRVLSWVVGDTAFHHAHHAKQNCNYGFYTGVWDYVFRTKA